MATTVDRALPAVAAPRRVRMTPRRVAFYLVLIAIALVFILPLLGMVSTALKLEAAVFTDQGLIPKEPTLANFERILAPEGDAPVFRWALNSFITAITGSALTVILTSLSGYAFARIDFPFKRLIFGLLIATLLLPPVLFLVPQFVIISNVGLTNTIPAFILPGLAGAFGVFFMRQFFLSIPLEIEEAAYVDGANRIRTFISVVLPLTGPAIATLTVLSFLGYWNDYLWPLIVCEGEGCTLTPGLRNFQGQYTFEYGILMAGAVIAAVPVLIVFVIAQRWVVQSVASSGVKG